MTIDMTQIIICIITLIVVPAFYKLLNAVVHYFNGKTDNETLKKVLADVNSSIQTQVNSLMQTVVIDMKEKSEDGKLTKEDADEILHTAIEKSANTLTKETKSYLEKHGVEIGTYLEDKIEAYIAEVKQY